MNIIEQASFKVSVADDSITSLSIAQHSDFSDYIRVIISEILEASRNKQYAFVSEDERVARNIINIIHEGDWSSCTNNIAEKLLEAEKIAQEEIKQLNKQIKKGVFLVVLFTFNNIKRMLLSKIDHDEFFDGDSLNLTNGFPTNKNKLQKSCLISFDSNNSIDEILISDTNSTISKYWWSGFLATREKQDDETNTKNAFSTIEKLLVKRVKKVSPADYWFIRNDIITYFRNENDFLFDQLAERIENHNVVSPKFAEAKDKFIEELKALPDLPNSKFDRQFTLVPKIIRSKIKKTIFLDNNFELKINGEIDDFRDKIISEADDRGKYIKIYSDKGYDEFSTGNNTEE